MQNCDEICNNLFVGNRQSLYNPYNYSMIVNCTPCLPFPECHSEYSRVSIHDHPDNSNQLVDILYNTPVLERINYHMINGGSVLINCNQGMQRSCAVCACYLIKYQGFTPMKAVNFIKSKRPQAFANQINFIQAIKKFNGKKYKLPL